MYFHGHRHTQALQSNWLCKDFIFNPNYYNKLFCFHIFQIWNAMSSCMSEWILMWLEKIIEGTVCLNKMKIFFSILSCTNFGNFDRVPVLRFFLKSSFGDFLKTQTFHHWSLTGMAGEHICGFLSRGPVAFNLWWWKRFDHTTSNPVMQNEIHEFRNISIFSHRLSLNILAVSEMKDKLKSFHSKKGWLHWFLSTSIFRTWHTLSLV